MYHSYTNFPCVNIVYNGAFIRLTDWLIMTSVNHLATMCLLITLYISPWLKFYNNAMMINTIIIIVYIVETFMMTICGINVLSVTYTKCENDLINWYELFISSIISMIYPIIIMIIVSIVYVLTYIKTIDDI